MSNREVFKDAFGRKEKTVYTDSAGHIMYENRYGYADEEAVVPNMGIQTYFRENGTKLSTEEKVYDEQIGMFRPVKKTHYDVLGRKEKTDHFDVRGQVSYTNEYVYESNKTVEPSGCVQVKFDNGQEVMKKITIYDKVTETFKIAKKSFYDSLKRPVMTTEYDREGLKSKEKIYTYREDGLMFVHREQFEKGKLIMKGDYMAINGSLIPYDMERNRFLTPSQKGSTSVLYPQLSRTSFGR